MSSRSSVLSFVTVVAGALVALGLLLVIFPLTLRMARGFTGFLWWFLPLLFTLAGLVSCVCSTKRTNIKILWVIIIVLAPFFGPLLWFLWGKNNT